MPQTKPVELKSLVLDLRNYRTVKQLSETKAVAAMISTSADRFWALTESLLADGYLPTENIVVLRDGNNLIVREGNRRVAALKLIQGQIKTKGLDIPDHIADAIKVVTSEWKTANHEVPCAIYGPGDKKTVDRIVTLAHGKGAKAGRENWKAVARARHGRDEEGGSEPGLDLLEKFLKETTTLSPDQANRWGFDYPLSVLDEAVKRLAPRLGLKSSVALAKSYPAIKHRKGVDSILHGIGMGNVGFKNVRSDTFGDAQGIPKKVVAPGGSHVSEDGAEETGASKGGSGGGIGRGGFADGDGGGGAGNGRGAQDDGGTGDSGKSEATAITDPRTVTALLKAFKPVGPNRQKVRTLLQEAVDLNLKKTPFAFCFVLRSLFEVSAKAYCDDNAPGGPEMVKANGMDRQLVDVLRDITSHLTNGGSNKKMMRTLHPAMVELAKSDGILSVTSMNQLIHHPHFSASPSDVARVFGNVFPLLKEMNA